MNGTGFCRVRQNKPSSGRKVPCIFLFSYAEFREGGCSCFFFFFKDMKIEVRLFWGSGTNQRREGDKNILMYIVCMVGKYDNEIL
jgi:hypothetical protein